MVISNILNSQKIKYNEIIIYIYRAMQRNGSRGTKQIH